MAFTQEEEDGLRAMLAVFRTQAPSLSDDVALISSAVFETWNGDSHAYAQGERIQYSGVLYTCLQAHTSQAGWAPGAAPSLWARVTASGTADTPSEEMPEWQQPTAENPYQLGARVRHNGKVWESLVANNVWEPGATGTETVWREVSGA